MKAMVITAFGSPDVFEQRAVPQPTPGPGEVLVKVRAVSINPVDYKIRQAGEWAGVKPPAILGYDVAGTIAAVGSGVTDFKEGDEVYYTPEIFGHQGSYAEYHVAAASIVARKPANLSFEEAACIPLAGGTAWDALIARMRLTVGETVLIHGTGGVGLFAIQIAHTAGARVIATASPATLDVARQFGAERVIDYHTGDVAQTVQEETGGAGVAAVFDTVGGENVAKSIEMVQAHGRMAFIAGVSGDLSGMQYKNITLHGVFLERERQRLDALRALAERGQLHPLIDTVLPLEEVAEAHRRAEHGGVKGKLVLRVQ